MKMCLWIPGRLNLAAVPFGEVGRGFQVVLKRPFSAVESEVCESAN